MAGDRTADRKQSTRRKAALIADQLAEAATKPREATNGVPAAEALMAQLTLRRVVPLLALAALTALIWRLGRRGPA